MRVIQSQREGDNTFARLGRKSVQFRSGGLPFICCGIELVAHSPDIRLLCRQPGSVKPIVSIDCGRESRNVPERERTYRTRPAFLVEIDRDDLRRVGIMPEQRGVSAGLWQQDCVRFCATRQVNRAAQRAPIRRDQGVVICTIRLPPYEVKTVSGGADSPPYLRIDARVIDQWLFGFARIERRHGKRRIGVYCAPDQRWLPVNVYPGWGFHRFRDARKPDIRPESAI